MVKKPFGWRREPARHSLASKGIGTKVKKPGFDRPALQPKYLRSGTPAITDELKSKAVDRVLVDAMKEGKDEAGAVELLEDTSWLKNEVGKVAEAECNDVHQREALKKDIVQTLQDNLTRSELQQESMR